jgi:hypothetical protein
LQPMKSQFNSGKTPSLKKAAKVH